MRPIGRARVARCRGDGSRSRRNRGTHRSPSTRFPRRRRRSRRRWQTCTCSCTCRHQNGGCARAQRRWWHTRARAQANNAVRRRFDHAAARAGSMRARRLNGGAACRGARNASCMMGKSSIATVILGTHPRWWRIGRWRRVVAVRIRVRRSWRPVAVGAWATVGTVGTRSAASYSAPWPPSSHCQRRHASGVER